MDQTTETTTAAANGIVPKEGWSWGGLMFNFSYLLGAKRYKMLWWFLLALVPFVNIVFWIVMVIYLGVNGHKLGANSAQFANQSEYDGYVKGLDHAGKITFFAGLIVAGCVILLAIAGISMGFLWGAHPGGTQY